MDKQTIKTELKKLSYQELSVVGAILNIAPKTLERFTEGKSMHKRTVNDIVNNFESAKKKMDSLKIEKATISED